MRSAIAAAILLLSSTAAFADGPSQAENYRQALRKAEQGDLAGAKALVAGSADRLLDKVLYWLDLTRWRGGSFETASAFLKANPDWPGWNGSDSSSPSRGARLASSRSRRGSPATNVSVDISLKLIISTPSIPERKALQSKSTIAAGGGYCAF